MGFGDASDELFLKYSKYYRNLVVYDFTDAMKKLLDAHLDKFPMK